MEVLLRAMANHGASVALVAHQDIITYDDILQAVAAAREVLTQHGVPRGAVVQVERDYALGNIARWLALVEQRCIVVPMAPEAPETNVQQNLAQVEFCWAHEGRPPEPTGRRAAHAHYMTLRERGSAGLVLFSSGSTGVAKGAVHDFNALLRKYHRPRPSQSMLAFMLLDHIGGVNTLFSGLSSGGKVVAVRERTPDVVCALIAQHGVATLPTTPTFLNLLLLSEAHLRHDLSGLRTITYGTEVMPESTLKRLRKVFPDVRLNQTYGLTEIGIMRSKSESSDSLWVRLGGEGFETRVRDGLLEVKAASLMLGYLNAPSPFTSDGWFKTGDAVVVRGDYFRIMGRTSDIINVGGEKVYPGEVESVLQMMPEVLHATVRAEANAITGHIANADVCLREDMPLREFRRRMMSFCGARLAPHKIPQRVRIVDQVSMTERFKKERRTSAP